MQSKRYKIIISIIRILEKVCLLYSLGYVIPFILYIVNIITPDLCVKIWIANLITGAIYSVIYQICDYKLHENPFMNRF